MLYILYIQYTIYKMQYNCVTGQERTQLQHKIGPDLLLSETVFIVRNTDDQRIADDQITGE